MAPLIAPPAHHHWCGWLWHKHANTASLLK